MSDRVYRPVLRIGQQTNRPVLEMQLRRDVDEPGTASEAADLTDATVTINAHYQTSGNVVVEGGEVEVIDNNDVDPVDGYVRYQFSKEELDMYGRVVVQFLVEYSDGDTEAFPAGGYYYVDVGPVLGGDGPQTVQFKRITAEEGVFEHVQLDSLTATEPISRLPVVNLHPRTIHANDTRTDRLSVASIIDNLQIEDLTATDTTTDTLTVKELTGQLVGGQTLKKLDGPGWEINDQGELQFKEIDSVSETINPRDLDDEDLYPSAVRTPLVETDRLDADEIHGVADRVIDTAADIEDLTNTLAPGETVYIAQPDTPYLIGNGYPTDVKHLDIDVSHVTIIFQSRYAANGEPILKIADGADVGGMRFGFNSPISDVRVYNYGYDGNYHTMDQTVLHLNGIHFENVTDFAVVSAYIQGTSPHNEYVGTDAHGTGGEGINIESDCSDYWIHRPEGFNIGDQLVQCRGERGLVTHAKETGGFDRTVSLSFCNNVHVIGVDSTDNADGAAVGAAGATNCFVSDVYCESRNAITISNSSNQVTVDGVHAVDTGATDNLGQVVRLRDNCTNIDVRNVYSVGGEWTSVVVNVGPGSSGTFSNITHYHNRFQGNGLQTEPDAGYVEFNNVNLFALGTESEFNRPIRDQSGAYYRNITIRDEEARPIIVENTTEAPIIENLRWDAGIQINDSTGKAVVNGRRSGAYTAAYPSNSDTETWLEFHRYLDDGDRTAQGNTIFSIPDDAGQVRLRIRAGGDTVDSPVYLRFNQVSDTIYDTRLEDGATGTTTELTGQTEWTLTDNSREGFRGTVEFDTYQSGADTTGPSWAAANRPSISVDASAGEGNYATWGRMATSQSVSQIRVWVTAGNIEVIAEMKR